MPTRYTFTGEQLLLALLAVFSSTIHSAENAETGIVTGLACAIPYDIAKVLQAPDRVAALDANPMRCAVEVGDPPHGRDQCAGCTYLVDQPVERLTGVFDADVEEDENSIVAVRTKLYTLFRALRGSDAMLVMPYAKENQAEAERNMANNFDLRYQFGDRLYTVWIRYPDFEPDEGASGGQEETSAGRSGAEN